MKFKKQIFALGAIAVIAAPIASVISCGSSSNKKKASDEIPTTYSAEKASTSGTVVHIGTNIVTYSSSKVVMGQTFTFVNEKAKTTTVYKVTAIGSGTYGALTLSVTTDGKPGTALPSATQNLPSANGLVLQDLSGTYYVANPTATNSTEVSNWVNFNTGILKGHQNERDAINQVATALAGTGYRPSRVDVASVTNIATVTTVVDNHSIVAGTASGFQIHVSPGLIFFLATKPVKNTTFTFKDSNDKDFSTITYTVDLAATEDSGGISGMVTNTDGSDPTAWHGTFKKTTTTGLTFKDYRGNFYMPNPIADKVLIAKWVSYNNIVAGTKDPIAAAKLISTALESTTYKCTKVIFSVGAFQECTIAKKI